MKKIIMPIASVFFILTVILVFSVVSCSAVSLDSSGKNYLVVGFDDAAENTDVISIVNFSRKSGNINVLQIPRDTYFRFRERNNKINGLYASKRASGMAPECALRELKAEIEGATSLRLDGAFGISTSSFSELVDSIGGVRVTLPEETVLRSPEGDVLLHLQKGENLLCGKDSLIFVRHRFGYSSGDLGRMDAQKIFFKGAVDSIRKNGEYLAILSRISRDDGIVSDFSAFDALPLLMELGRADSLSVNSVTLPGEAIKAADGVWYYILNRPANLQLLGISDEDSNKKFDPEHRFSDVEISDFEKIYNKPGYRVTSQP